MGAGLGLSAILPSAVAAFSGCAGMLWVMLAVVAVAILVWLTLGRGPQVEAVAR